MGEKFYETVDYDYTPEYKALEKAVSEQGNISISDFEKRLNSAVENNDFYGVLSLTNSADFGEAFRKIFAIWRDVYKGPAGPSDNDFEFRHLTHYMLSDDVRKRVLEFCTRLPVEIADEIAPEIQGLVYENYPKHKVGYSDSEKLEVLRKMAERGSKKSLEIISQSAGK